MLGLYPPGPDETCRVAILGSPCDSPITRLSDDVARLGHPCRSNARLARRRPGESVGQAQSPRQASELRFRWRNYGGGRTMKSARPR